MTTGERAKVNQRDNAPNPHMFCAGSRRAVMEGLTYIPCKGCIPGRGEISYTRELGEGSQFKMDDFSDRMPCYESTVRACVFVLTRCAHALTAHNATHRRTSRGGLVNCGEAPLPFSVPKESCRSVHARTLPFKHASVMLHDRFSLFAMYSEV